MKTAYFDCIGGIAGDMALGALLDAGASLEELEKQLQTLPVSGWKIERKVKQIGAIEATHLRVRLDSSEQPHRHLKDIVAIIEGAGFSKKVKAQAIRVFEALAKAEASVHGETIDSVHFHEVGAVDAIIDIVGVCLALEALGIGRVECSPLPLGHGVINCEHGLIPLPAPATVELLKGKPTYGIDVRGETVTPTGAALMSALAADFGPQPKMRLETAGYGAGTREQNHPNLTRVMIGEADGDAHEVTRLETNLDDMTPETAGYLMEKLLQNGALDAYYTPATMKKNRPGFVLSVLCPPDLQTPIIDLILRETPTFGVRFSNVQRVCLPRRLETVQTPLGPVRVKIGELNGKPLTVSPEFEDCRTLAESQNVPLREVYALAMNAYQG